MASELRPRACRPTRDWAWSRRVCAASSSHRVPPVSPRLRGLQYFHGLGGGGNRSIPSMRANPEGRGEMSPRPSGSRCVVQGSSLRVSTGIVPVEPHVSLVRLPSTLWPESAPSLPIPAFAAGRAPYSTRPTMESVAALG